jgi:hypothetical protein
MLTACGGCLRPPWSAATASAARVTGSLLPPPGWQPKSRGETPSRARPSARPSCLPRSAREGCSSGLGCWAGRSAGSSFGSSCGPSPWTRSLVGRLWWPLSPRGPSWRRSCRRPGRTRTSCEPRPSRHEEPDGGSGALLRRKGACGPCSGGSGRGPAAFRAPASLSVQTVSTLGSGPC